jgi:hypothetical protein
VRTIFSDLQGARRVESDKFCAREFSLTEGADNLSVEAFGGFSHSRPDALVAAYSDQVDAFGTFILGEFEQLGILGGHGDQF